MDHAQRHSPTDVRSPLQDDAAAGAAPRSLHRTARRALAWTLALAALGGVFALYLQPAVLVTLADQVWACFN